MAWMHAEGGIGRVVWSDRTTVRPTTEATVRRIGREWVTVPAKGQPLSDWRKGSSYVTTDDAQ